jgi:integrase
MLISAGVDIATIAKRLGHASPAITLSVYSHRFKRDDRAAADAIDRLAR